MLKIIDIYNNLSYDKEVTFQIKNKIIFENIINELKPIFKRDWESDNFLFLEEEINYKNAYFILGNWRDGMFKLRVGKNNTHDYEIYILADYKESPISESRHLEQIKAIINILDKYRNYVVKKRLILNADFNLVRR